MRSRIDIRMEKWLFRFAFRMGFCLAIGLLSLNGKAAETASAPTGSFEQIFRQGLEAYQGKSYEKAREFFENATQLQPGNTAAMVNLALSYYQLGDAGRAIAYFRRTLVIDPEQTEALNGLKFAWSQLPVKEIPHRIETMESLRDHFLLPVSLPMYLGLTAILWLATGWFFLAWLGQRRRALQTEMAPPPFSPRSGLLFVLALLATSLAILKTYDASVPRGTIVGEKIPAQSAPDRAAVPLFDLHPGFEVIIREMRNDWVQVTYPGGLTGWISQKNLIPTTGGPS